MDQKDTMSKKKSKYKSLIINKKRYYFYKITWIDILGDSGHADANEMRQMQPAVMVTNAYVFMKDKKRLITFSSYDTSQESFSDRNVFPIGCILKMEKQNIQEETMIKKCKQCKKDFETTDFEMKAFCSDECKQEAIAEMDKNSDECLSCQ